MKDPVAVELLEPVEHYSEQLAEHFVLQKHLHIHHLHHLIKEVLRKDHRQLQNRHFLQELDLQTYHLGIY